MDSLTQIALGASIGVAVMGPSRWPRGLAHQHHRFGVELHLYRVEHGGATARLAMDVGAGLVWLGTRMRGTDIDPPRCP